MDITKKTVEELKALAYDQMAIKQQAEMNLQALNEEIGKKIKEDKPKKDKKE